MLSLNSVPYMMCIESKLCCMALKALVSRFSPPPLLVSPTDRSICIQDLLNWFYAMSGVMRLNMRGF